MKKVLILILILFYLGSVYAQKTRVKNDPEYDERPIHFGYTLGFNFMDFVFGRNSFKNPSVDTLYADLGQRMLGFQVGIVSDFRIGEYFNIRFLPSFNFGQRNLGFYVVNRETNKINKIKIMQLESSMLDFPLLLKYKAKRVNNYRPYIIAGGSVRYDLAAKKNYDEGQEEYILLNPLDVYYEMGFGIDYYLPYFKFSTEIKFSLGILNILNRSKKSSTHPEYLNSLNELNSEILMFSMHFE